MKLSPSLSTSDVGIKIPYYSLHGEVEFKNVNFSYPTRKDHVSCNTDFVAVFLLMSCTFSQIFFLKITRYCFAISG